MCRKNWFVSMLVLAALLLSTFQPVLAQDAPGPEPVGLRPDAPEYAKHGPFWVGHRPLLIDEGTDHPLEVGIWYPALNPTGEKEEVTYQIPLKLPVGDTDDPSVIYGRALLDAEVDASAGPFPLVVFSHGFSCNPEWYSDLIENYASYGFVVLAPEHMEQWDPEWSEIWSASIDRPADIKQTLDYAEQITAPGGEMEGLIDMGNVAVAGHSYGGYTSLAMAGAQYDLEAFNARCAELAPDDPNTFLCAPVVPHEADMAARAGLDPMPEGLWPSFGDSRVTAIIPIASDSYLFDRAGLSKITVPMMAIGGTADTGTPYDWGVRPAYDNASSERKALVTLEHAEHTITTKCEGMPWIDDTPFYEWVCFDPVWDKDRGIDLINHFSTAFLLAELKGDADAAAALAPENVSFPGIQYESTGYTTAAALDPAQIAQIDAYVEEMMASNGLPGFALGVVKDGELAYAKGFGVANVDTGEPVTPQTVFQVAEVTFAPTALAVLKLAEQGLIDLDAPITEYLPYFKMAGEGSDQMTVRHLLLHTSGVPDSGDMAADWTAMAIETDDGAVERFVRSLADVELLFVPGEGYEWSDRGYDILGAVVAAVTDQPFESVMQENLLTPLGMAHSTFLLDEVDPALFASPHIEDDAGAVLVADVIPYSRQFAAANNLFSNVEDMARLIQANLNRGELDGTRILPAEYYDDMWLKHGEMPFGGFVLGQLYPIEPFTASGIGWIVTEIEGQPVVHSYGGERGYQSDMMLCPELGLGVIAMGNGAAGGAVFSTETAIDVMGMLIDASGEGAAQPAPPQVFVQGSALPGLMDFAIGPDGNIYAGSEFGQMIAVVDPETGEIVARYGEAEGIDPPMALTVGPDGTIYWTSFYTLQICSLSPQGEKRCQDLPEDTWALAFAPDGRLFVSGNLHVQTIYEVDPALQEPPRPIIEMSSLPAFFKFGPDGLLYVPLLMEGKIVRVDVNADPVTVETAVEGLAMPWSVAFDSAGKLYVATSEDAEHNAIVAVDISTGAVEEIAQLPPGYHTLEITADDRILAGHYDEGAIYELMPDGEVRPLTTTGIVAPGGLAVQLRADGGESIFVAGWKTLYELDGASGELLGSSRSTWFPGSITTPRTVAADGDNLLISAWPDQWGGNALQIWDPAGGMEVAANAELVSPANAIRFQGDIVVVEMQADAPWTVSRTNGDDFADRHEIGAGFLQQPLGLAAGEDDLWVADYAAGDIMQLVAGGEELAEPATIVTGLDGPEGLALAPDGRLLVAETGAGRLLAIDPITGAQDVLAEGLGFALSNPVAVGTNVSLPPHFVFSGVAVGPSGNVYVSGDAANAIYRIPLAQ